MLRSSHAATLIAVSILGAAAAHAEILNVNVTAPEPANSSFDLSFDLNTAATTNTIGLGGCYSSTDCAASDIYTTFSATGGISNAHLSWNGTNYGLQSSNISLDWQGGNVFDLDLTLDFNNNTGFAIVFQPTAGPYSSLQYTPSEVLTSATLSSYNGSAIGVFVADGGNGGEFFDGVDMKTTVKSTSVPEPGSLALLTVGLAAMAALNLSRRRIAWKTGK